MFRFTCKSLLFLFLAVSISLSASTVSDRAKDVVNVINSGNKAAATTFIKQNYAAHVLKVPIDAHLDFLLELHDQSRGLEIREFQNEKPNSVNVLLENKLTGELELLSVEIEDRPPYRLTHLGMQNAPVNKQEANVQLTDTQIAEQLDTFMRRLADADVFSGAVLLAHQGKPFYEKAFGEANKDFGVPNKVDTKFNLGSMNKMFTAVAIAQLAEANKLSFEDPIARFLPNFPNRSDAQKIKIKHLLTHTSGLGSYFNKKFVESSRANFRTVDDFMKLAKGEKSAFKPGTRWQYSNTGFLILGAIIEKASGKNYFDYVRDSIFRVAGMTNTDSYELDLVNLNLAVGYQKEFTDDGIRFRNNLFEHVIQGGPAGGGYSTVEDLSRFATALTQGKLVGRTYVDLLLSPKPELNSPDYGYGFGVNAESRIAGHGGGFPGISSNLDIFFDKGYVSVVLSNYGGGSHPVVGKTRQLLMTAKE